MKGGEMLRKAIKKVFPHRKHRYKCSCWVIGWGNDAVVTSKEKNRVRKIKG